VWDLEFRGDDGYNRLVLCDRGDIYKGYKLRGYWLDYILYRVWG
jgi:hypothetical protein